MPNDLPPGPAPSPSFAELRDQRDLTGRVALVTGAGSGIGRATARLFAALGARVAAADVDADGVAATAAGIVAEGGTCLAVDLDVTDVDAITAALARIRSELGPVDALVNNAGISGAAGVRGAEADDATFDALWERSLAVNLTAHTRLVRACLPDLERRDDDGRCHGRIVNIASTEGLGATPGLPAYTASKHGVIGLTRALAVELGGTGVTANAVCPGPVDTGMTAAIPEAARQKYLRRRVPVQRYAQPEELAHVIVSLCLPGASFVNGAVVTADGGLTVKNA